MSNRGFAAMDKEKVKEIARKGGQARKAVLGPEGYARMGHQGGEARKRELGPEGYARLGHKGGASKKQTVETAPSYQKRAKSQTDNHSAITE